MSFTPVKNVRISSLTPGAVVQLRFGKAAVKSNADATVEAKLVRHFEEGEKEMAVFETAGDDGATVETTISRFPGASWKADAKYVSLISVDESTHSLLKAASPISTDVIGQAIALIGKEADDVFGADQLAALLTLIKDGNRINTEIKAQAHRLSIKLVEELSNLPEREAAPADAS